MKRIVTCMLLSLFLSAGTVGVMASTGKSPDKKEQRDKRNDGRKQNKKQNNKNDRNKGKKSGKDYRPGKGHSLPAPGHNASRPAPAPVHRPVSGGHHTPPPPPPGAHRHSPIPPPPPRLSSMVSHATRGCRDVAVWQVNPDTYIVKYRKGRRYYTQYLYPYSGRYGDCSLITVNWQPLSPWTLIPPIQLNINL